jgi:uncharacterized membrane protein
MNNPKSIGLAVGLLIGIILVWLGPWQALVVAVFALVGWLIGKFVAGDAQFLDALLERFVEERGRRRRE